MIAKVASYLSVRSRSAVRVLILISTSSGKGTETVIYERLCSCEMAEHVPGPPAPRALTTSVGDPRRVLPRAEIHLETGF